jgi:UDP-N-acetylmuramoylalanine--D-glutamate ligase
MSINFDKQRILILGAGVTGSAVARALQSRGGLVTIADDNAPEAIKSEQVNFSNFDAVVISPGWRQDHPLVVKALASDLPILNEIDLAWQLRTDLAPHQKWLALTGTNGKTTVSTLCHQILQNAGQETGLITLALSANDCKTLSKHLENLGFKVHPAKNR